MSDHNILFVDDEDDLRTIMQEALESNGYHVSMAADGARALELLKGEQTFSHLVTDVRMPGEVTGLEVASAALARSPTARVIIVSGYQRSQLPALPDGAIFISKPYRIRQLLTALEAA
jgi:two-component system cell cycle response regulator CpdR